MGGAGRPGNNRHRRTRRRPEVQSRLDRPGRLSERHHRRRGRGSWHSISRSGSTRSGGRPVVDASVRFGLLFLEVCEELPFARQALENVRAAGPEYARVARQCARRSPFRRCRQDHHPTHHAAEQPRRPRVRCRCGKQMARQPPWCTAVGATFDADYAAASAQ
jgi:hypothetical protein